jgi:tetrahydromethanopterin S-methyltransferase subunit E
MLSKIKTVGLGVAALSGAAVGGAAVAGAANSNSGATTVPPAASGKPPPALRDMPAQGTAAHEDHEKAVTGEAADKAQAAAIKAAGGGTAGDVTTDYFGNGYEVTVTKSDGSKVEIHLDSSFDVMAGPGGRGGGPPPAGFGTIN